MILLANGCSFTWGGGLNFREDQEDLRLQHTWPHYLGLKLNRSVVNLSAGCGSNQRIIRTNLDWISQQTDDVLKNTIAVIQWTDPSRYEYYEPLNSDDYLENFPNRWAKVNAQAVIGCREDSSPEKSKRDHERKNKRYETHTMQEDMYRTISDISSMSKIFEDFGVKYYYWTYSHLSDKFLPHIRKYYKTFPWLNEPLNGEPYDWLLHWDYEIISNTDTHPSLLGHQQIADLIFEKIKKTDQPLL
jgi:hypothetical protein